MTVIGVKGEINANSAFIQNFKTPNEKLKDKLKY